VILAAANTVFSVYALGWGPALILHVTVFLPKIVIGLVYLSKLDFRIRTLRSSGAANKGAQA
jgi:hypothetical protein